MTSSISSVGSAIPTLTSALQGYDRQVEAAATNIASVDSTGSKTLRAEAISLAPGMRVAVQPVAQDVDLTRQLVDLTTASADYRAAATALGSISRTEKRALDVIG
jgi:hypothetical protein